MRLFRKTDRGAELEAKERRVKYVVDEMFLHSLLEAVYRFTHEHKPLEKSYVVSEYDQRYIEEQALKSGEYLRGVAATLNDPERMDHIADTLDTFARLVSFGVSIEPLEREE